MHGKELARAAVRVSAAWLLFPSGEALAQCAMCWQALAQSAEGERLIGGFQEGIVFLLLIPFLVVGSLVFLIYKAQRHPASGDRSGELEFGSPAQTRPPGNECAAGVPARE